jgi:hypothetical protein
MKGGSKIKIALLETNRPDEFTEDEIAALLRLARAANEVGPHCGSRDRCEHCESMRTALDAFDFGDDEATCSHVEQDSHVVVRCGLPTGHAGEHSIGVAMTHSALKATS